MKMMNLKKLNGYQLDKLQNDLDAIVDKAPTMAERIKMEFGVDVDELIEKGEFEKVDELFIAVSKKAMGN